MHTTPPRLTAGTLTLRPWNPKDSAGLVELYRDEALRRWTSDAVHDEAGAARWVTAQQRGWEAGDRLAFAVEEAPEETLEETPAETRAPGTATRLVGNVVLKYAARGCGLAEVGYWTAAHARGQGSGPARSESADRLGVRGRLSEGLTRLELLHQVDNVASCRVAEKAGFPLTGTLPAAPPAFPLDGHAHVRHAPGRLTATAAPPFPSSSPRSAAGPDGAGGGGDARCHARSVRSPRNPSPRRPPNPPNLLSPPNPWRPPSRTSPRPTTRKPRHEHERGRGTGRGRAKGNRPGAGDAGSRGSRSRSCSWCWCRC
ncbi:hypothetical protein SHIRM173S_01968 [Streptomyces hirsutus]